MCFDLTFRETKLNSARKALVLLKFELAEAQGAVVFVTYLKFFVSPTFGIIIVTDLANGISRVSDKRS